MSYNKDSYLKKMDWKSITIIRMDINKDKTYNGNL